MSNSTTRKAARPITAPSPSPATADAAIEAAAPAVSPLDPGPPPPMPAPPASPHAGGELQRLTEAAALRPISLARDAVTMYRTFRQPPEVCRYRAELLEWLTAVELHPLTQNN